MYSLEAPILKKKFSKTSLTDYPDQETYANLPPDIDGQYQPVLLGGIGSGVTDDPTQFLYGLPCKIIDPGTQQGSPNEDKWRARKFKICADIKNPETGTVHGLDSSIVIIRYQNQTALQLTAGTHYDLADNYTEVDFKNDINGELIDDAEIHIDGATIKDDASATFTGTASAPIAYLPDVLHFLLVCFAGISTSKIDVASFTRSGVTKQGVSGTWTFPSWLSSISMDYSAQGAYLDSQITVREMADQMAFSCGHIIAISDTTGKYILRPIEPNTLSTDAYLTDAGISGFTEKLRLDATANRILVQWCQIPAGPQTILGRPINPFLRTITLTTGAFLTKQNELTRTIDGKSLTDDFRRALTGTERELIIQTYLRNSTVAQALANYWYKQLGRGRWEASFTDVNGNLMQSIASDRAIIYRTRSAQGSIASGKTFRLIDMVKNHSNNVVSVSQADEVIP